MFGGPPPAELENWPAALVLDAAMILGVGLPKEASRPFWTAVTLAAASAPTAARFDDKSVRNWYGGETAIGWHSFPGLAELFQHEEPHGAAWVELLRQKNIELEPIKGPGSRAVRRAATKAVKRPF